MVWIFEILFLYYSENFIWTKLYGHGNIINWPNFANPKPKFDVFFFQRLLWSIVHPFCQDDFVWLQKNVFLPWFNAILNGLKHVTLKGWSICEMWKGKVTMSSPNFVVCPSVFIVTCDPWPSIIKRWWFCWEIPPSTYLKKRGSQWLKMYAIVQAFICMTMHDPSLHNFM